jgi:hypothetical protein
MLFWQLTIRVCCRFSLNEYIFHIIGIFQNINNSYQKQKLTFNQIEVVKNTWFPLFNKNNTPLKYMDD